MKPVESDKITDLATGFFRSHNVARDEGLGNASPSATAAAFFVVSDAAATLCEFEAELALIDAKLEVVSRQADLIAALERRHELLDRRIREMESEDPRR